MFGEKDLSTIADELEACRRVIPDHHIRLIAGDAILKVRIVFRCLQRDNTPPAHQSCWRRKRHEMSDSMTGKQLALARRQALSVMGIALRPQAVKSNGVQASRCESVPATLSAKERCLMSQTGKAALPMTDRTRASTMANQSCDCESPPPKTKPRVSTRSGPSGVVEDSPGRIAAKARREALASDGKSID